MTMHPELEEAFNTGLSMPEVFELFTKHYSGLKEDRVDIHSHTMFDDPVHTDGVFWYEWRPLVFCRLPMSWGLKRPVSEPFMHIHKVLTREIMSWLCDVKKRSNVYLIAEPQLPPTTDFDMINTRAYVFSNVCYDAQRFGLPMRNEPDGIRHGIDSIIAELAAYYAPYRRILAKELVDNPGILELSTHTRFRKLIHEPWKALRESHPQYITTPPVLVLFLRKSQFTGWDEEFLRSIYEFGSSQHSSPLLWIISSDTNLKLSVQDLLHPFPPFRYFRLPVSYKESPADAALILHHRFSVLRNMHKDIFDEGEVWPSEKQMSQLIMIVSGVVRFVEVIIQFIDWEEGGGPKSHLETFLAYMVHSPSPSDERPFCALDHFYMRALSDIPPDLLPLFKQVSSIISPEIFGWPFGGSFELRLAILLSLGKDALFNMLPHAYRLIWLRAYGTSSHSVSHFLADPMRSGQFYVPQSESYLYIFQALLHTLYHASNLIAMLKPMVQETQASAKSYWVTIDSLRYIFFRLLYLEKVNEPNIVRTRPDFENMELSLHHSEAQTEEWIRLHTTRPKYLLLGSGSETVLAVIYESWFYGVNIYTSAMLDYM
ncbi:hypothetical protein AGABI2DRAFT_179070 [Agaricus bisporus var. bisporus H97]|uniref:hypothetical protein n=1 Tax=Agaricus bisporus var. bisporus (strain H97 / ATCC MYA-4626 / FGSC 10389) TaxID=936046 RepID=UPI00029F7D3F|nr:hypothetical protein AGABI2DRAFT_179070 [Agaricus bisporus var. bisporus H97]EKV46906.1 hypothetical protein AGABI2DRAFT_179070 [Agaricus bisporus var. bisporus H97]